MKEYPTEHLCTCSPEERWVKRTLYERIVETQTSPLIEVSSAEEAEKLTKVLNSGEVTLDETPYIYESYFPVLVCDGCEKEVMMEKDNWYSNWVREGEHFVNDLHILLETLAHYMHLADKSGNLEFKGTTFSNTMEKLE